MSESALELLDRLVGPEGAKGSRRLVETLTDFPGGYTAGWRFELPEAFALALDIRVVEVREEGVARLAPRQASSFDFGRGDVLYDTRRAYEDRALARLAVQVRSATPVRRADNDLPRDPGVVVFELYVQSADGKRFESRGTHPTTQDDFLRFLIAGPPEEWERIAAAFRALGLPPARSAPPRVDPQGALF